MSTLVELPDRLRDPMRREVNRGLMVRFINADLLNRAGLDVRKSIVFYDADGLFEYAAPDHPTVLTMFQRIHDETNIRYYSKGI